MFGGKNGHCHKVGLRHKDIAGSLHPLDIPHKVPAEVLDVQPSLATFADVCQPPAPASAAKAANSWVDDADALFLK